MGETNCCSGPLLRKEDGCDHITSFQDIYNVITRIEIHLDINEERECENNNIPKALKHTTTLDRRLDDVSLINDRLKAVADELEKLYYL